MGSDKETNRKKQFTLVQKMFLAFMIFFASVIAFCGTCAPIGTVGFFLSYPFRTDTTRGVIGYWIQIAGFIAGGIAAVWAGYRVSQKLISDWHKYNDAGEER